MFTERPGCPVCAGTDTTIVYDQPYTENAIRTYLTNYYDLEQRNFDYDAVFAGHNFTLKLCTACKAITQHLAPDDELSMMVYSDWIDEGDGEEKRLKRYPFSEYTHHIQEAMIITAFLLRYTGKRSPRDLRVFDFGLGWSRWAMAMKACGCEVAGTDLSPPRIEHARANGITVLDYADIPHQAFDFINTEQVFEHLPAPRETARHLVQGLSPQGVLKISVPYTRWLEGRTLLIDWSATRYATRSPMPVAPLEHLNYFQRPSLNVLAAQVELHEVRYSALTELNYAFDWSGPRQMAKNLLRPLGRKWWRNYYLFSRKG